MDELQLPLTPAGTPQRPSFRNWLRKQLVIEKMGSPLGFAILLLVSLALGSITALFGAPIGMVILVMIIALPSVYATVAYPQFGIAVLISVGYLLFYLIRMSIPFPLGTLMDSLQALLILGFFIKQRTAPNWKILKGPISIGILAWVFYNIFEVINPAAESYQAWVYTIRTAAIAPLTYFIFLYHIRTKEYLRFLLKLWLFLACIGAGYGYIQEFHGYSASEMAFINSDPLVTSLYFVGGHWRKFSIFSDPVAFAYNMVVAALLALALLTGLRQFWKKIILAILALFFLNAMLFSGTRGAYVLIPIALAMFAILKYNKTVLLFSIVAGFFIAALIFMPTSNVNLVRFQSAFRPSQDESFNVRKANQKRIQPYILSHPMGGGLGATGAWGQRFAPNSYLAKFPPDSGYVRVAVELGWIGMLLFCTLMFIIMRAGIITYFRIRDPELKGYCLAMVLIIFAYNIGNYPQEALVQFPSNILFYLAAAIIGITARIDETQQNQLYAGK